MYTLYTWTTPNGVKASIMLEELGVPYKVHSLDISTNVQKEPWYLEINPNGRIPAIVDHDEDDFAVFESGAILHYLAKKHGRLLPSDAKGESLVMQWLMFQMGGVGPMQGQANHFVAFAPEDIPYAKTRYLNETRRLYEILDTQLQKHDYLAGDYSIADIATWPWVACYYYCGVDIEGLDALKAWMQRVRQRPAVQKGIAVPKPFIRD